MADAYPAGLRLAAPHQMSVAGGRGLHVVVTGTPFAAAGNTPGEPLLLSRVAPPCRPHPASLLLLLASGTTSSADGSLGIGAGGGAGVGATDRVTLLDGGLGRRALSDACCCSAMLPGTRGGSNGGGSSSGGVMRKLCSLFAYY